MRPENNCFGRSRVMSVGVGLGSSIGQGRDTGTKMRRLMRFVVYIHQRWKGIQKDSQVAEWVAEEQHNRMC